MCERRRRLAAAPAAASAAPASRSPPRRPRQSPSRSQPRAPPRPWSAVVVDGRRVVGCRGGWTWRRARWGAGGASPRTPLRAPPRVAASFHTFRCGDAQQYDSGVDIRRRVTVAAWTEAREALASRRRGVLCRWRGWRRGVDLGPFATLASSVRGRRGEGAPAAGR